MIAPQKSAHLVLGGGLAGSMLALRLAEAGSGVTLLERERTPHHKVCGEFLSPEAVHYLHRAAIDPIALGAQPIRFLRLAAGRRVIQTALPFTALSLSRCVLDEALLTRAAQSGCTVLRSAFVQSLQQENSLWTAQLRDGASHSAHTLFLATGKHDLRGLERHPGPHSDPQNEMIGFKLQWRLAPAQTEALRNYMDLYLFKGGYGGLSLVEGDAATLCLVVRRGVLHKIGDWPKLLASIQQQTPHLALRLSGASPLWERPLAVSAIPYGYLGGRPNLPNLWRLGYQAACIPSFTGDGMSIALHSASLAAEMHLAGQSSNEYHQTLRTHLHRGMTLATTLSRLMVTTLGRTLAPIALTFYPGAMQSIAGHTRIPDYALIHSS